MLYHASHAITLFIKAKIKSVIHLIISSLIQVDFSLNIPIFRFSLGDEGGGAVK